jgi:2-polyprenyl-3-methyl-5-hydroxy-6-metoxy-1,4-benzoquinol methylase
MILENIASNIELGPNKIYYSKSGSQISYPDEGNDICMQIEEHSFWFQHRNNAIVQLVSTYNNGKPFFDIGGGNGFVSKRIQAEGIETVLVEPGATGVLNAKKRGIKNIICSTLEDAQFAPKSMDSVGMFDVVEHIEDDLGLLKNVHSCLKEKGHVYITVPAFQTLWSNEDKDAGHFRRYTSKSIDTLLKTAGFEVIYSTYLFSILPLPIFFFRSLTSKLGLNKRSNDLEKHKKKHSVNKSSTRNLIDPILNWEIRRLKQSKKIRIGSSCIVVAKKV